MFANEPPGKCERRQQNASTTSGDGHTMATGDTASDPFSRSAQHAFPTARMRRKRLRRPAPRRPAAPGRRHVAFVAEQPEKRRLETRGDQQMSATLKLTHKAIGAEVRRGTYDVVVDGKRVGSGEMNHTIEMPVEPGRHTLQVRNGRNSSSTQTFDAAEEEIVAFRCTGKI